MIYEDDGKMVDGGIFGELDRFLAQRTRDENPNEADHG